jgi:hypothetical protein
LFIDRIGEAIEDMRARRIGRPAVMLGDRVGYRRLEFLMKARLKFGITLETDLLHHAGDRRRRHAGILGHSRDAAESGNRIVVEKRRCQLFFRARQHGKMGVDHIRHRHGACSIGQNSSPKPVFASSVTELTIAVTYSSQLSFLKRSFQIPVDMGQNVKNSFQFRQSRKLRKITGCSILASTYDFRGF